MTKWFKPTLESLEDRTSISGPGYSAVLGGQTGKAAIVSVPPDFNPLTADTISIDVAGNRQKDEGWTESVRKQTEDPLRKR